MRAKMGFSLLSIRNKRAHTKTQKIKAISTQRKKHNGKQTANKEKTNKKTIYTHTGILIQNFYHPEHNYTAYTQKNQLFDDYNS